MRRFFVCLGFLFLLLNLPGLVRAWSIDDWRVIGATDQAWLFEEGVITGVAEDPSRRGFLITDDLRVTIGPNFIFRFKLTPLRGVDHNFVWNFQDERNYYQAHFYGSGVEVARIIDGQQMLSVVAPVTIVQNQTYQIEFSQRDSYLALKVDDIQILAFDDWLHDGQSRGSVGFKLAPGTVFPLESKFAEIEWENLMAEQVNESVEENSSSVSLQVDLLKQTDPAWGNLEYDSASVWSNQPTIGRWGCALTSLVMIMRHYRLVNMPDDQPVTPATVNAWLQNQPDGYVGQSLVNWWAGLRLVREISEQYSTADNLLPKLEFAFVAEDWQMILTEELLADRPAIVNVPGHFLIADGLTENSEDFLIKDPFYDYDLLSEHESFQSLRLFRPSQTNLSAIVVVHAPHVAVELIDELGELIGETWTENYSFGNEENSEAWRFTVLNQPTDGYYQLSLNGVTNREDVGMFSYDQTGEVVSFLLPLGFEEMEMVSIDFMADRASYFTPSFSWQRWWEELARLRSEGNLSTVIYERLNDLAWRAEEQSLEVQQRYQFYSLRILEFYQAELEPNTLGYLRALIGQELGLALSQ